jgi:hypothetical protein
LHNLDAQRKASAADFEHREAILPAACPIRSGLLQSGSHPASDNLPPTHNKRIDMNSSTIPYMASHHDDG